VGDPLLGIPELPLPEKLTSRKRHAGEDSTVFAKL
jgi:hypothetical protein